MLFELTESNPSILDGVIDENDAIGVNFKNVGDCLLSVYGCVEVGIFYVL